MKIISLKSPLQISLCNKDSLDTKIQNKIKLVKENKNQFFSLVIGYSPINEFFRDYFDREWLFNPRNSSVTEIVNLIK